jgi:hypothetical protein
MYVHYNLARLGEGTHVLTTPLRPPRGCRVVIRSETLARRSLHAAPAPRLGGGGAHRGWKSKLAEGMAERGLWGGDQSEGGASGQAGGANKGKVGASVEEVKFVGTQDPGVVLRAYGEMSLVTLKDDQFVSNPFCQVLWLSMV